MPCNTCHMLLHLVSEGLESRVRIPRTPWDKSAQNWGKFEVAQLAHM